MKDIYKVTCSCGFRQFFDSEEFAREVFEAHAAIDSSSEACGSGSLEQKLVYEDEDDIQPEDTVPCV